MDVQLCDVAMTDTVGIATMLTRSQTENFRIISQLWKRFNRELHAISNRPRSSNGWEKFGITYPLDGGYGYLAAIPDAPAMYVPEQMRRKTIPAGQYARFTHTGPMYHLKSTIHAIYTTHLPALERHRPTPEDAGLFHFERYDARFHWNRADSCIDVFVPLTRSPAQIGVDIHD